MAKEELKPIDVSKYKVTETGQVLKMTKEELTKKADTNHARVSQLVELEKENAELERKLEQTEKNLADYQFNYPTIKELQKENAELKGDNKVMADNLTKAKEIIRELLNSCFGYKSKTVNYEVKVKAEQFLKEEQNGRTTATSD